MDVPARALARRPRTPWLPIALIGALMIVPLVSSAPIRASAPLPHRADPAVSGFAALGAASATLSTGAGPAFGAPSQCRFSPGGSAVCATVPSYAAPVPGVPTAPVWTNLSANSSTPPSGRVLGSMVWDAFDHYVLLFGGCTVYTCDGTMNGDTWIFQDGQWRELDPSNSPSGRSIAGMAYDAADHEVVLYGGLGATPAAGCSPYCTALNDTWTYANGTWTNLTGNLTVAPTSRYRASMAYDAADGYVVLFGGTPTNDATAVVYNQTWTFVDQKWTLITPKGHPVPKFRAGMAYDAADGYLVLFGGCQFIAASPCATDQTWTYVAGVWTNETKNESSSPNARVYFGIAFDPRDDFLLLVDGGVTSTGPPVGGTWKFSAGQWTNLSSGLSLAPSARAEEMLVEDPSDNTTLLFGGYPGSPANPTLPLLSDTWGFGARVYANLHVAPPSLDRGQTGTLTVYAESDFRPVTYWYRTLPSPCDSANTSDLACAPTSLGVHPLEVEVNDSTGDSAYSSWNLSVVADPAIASYSITPRTLTQGVPINISVNATGGVTPYRFAYSHLPSGCGSVDRNYVTCTPAASGNLTVEVQVTDASAYSVFGNSTVTVNPRPGVASFVATPGVIDLGQSTTFRLDVANGTGPYGYAYSGLPYGCAAVNASLVPCTPKRAGPSAVRGTVTDAYGYSANATTSVQVNAALEVFSDGVSSNGVIDLGRSFRLWLNVTSGTAPYSYFYYGLPAGCASSNGSTMLCTPTAAGNTTITGNVSDAVGVYRTVSYNVSVRAPLAIVRSDVAPLAVDLGLPANFSVVYTGGTAPYTLAYTGLPTGCASASVTPLGCAPQAAGTFPVKATVTDAFGVSTSSMIVLTVNRDPSVTGFGGTPGTFTLGGSTTLQVNVSGGTGSVGYRYQGLPAGCPTSDSATLTCTPTASGTFTVQVTVTDSLGESTTATTQITVQPPGSSSGPSLGGASGTTLDLLIAGLVLALAVVAVLALALRRRREPPPEETLAPAETAAEPSPWDEGTPPSDDAG